MAIRMSSHSGGLLLILEGGGAGLEIGLMFACLLIHEVEEI